MNTREKNQLAFRLLRGVILALFVLFSLPVSYLAILLVFSPETFRGFICGLSVLLFNTSIVICIAAFYFNRRRRFFYTGGAMFLSTVPLLLVAYLLTPIGIAENGRIRSLFRGSAEYHRWSPANMVPEIDQLKLGTRIVASLDPIVTVKQSERIRRLFLNIYHKMRHDNDFNKLGSALGLCYLDLFTGKRPDGHFYEYIPSHHGKRLPVVIFMHGSLGNFKGYMWCWKEFADRNKFAVLAPTFGAGDWEKPGGVEAIQHILDYCGENPDIDEDRIYLAGVSNGAKGVTRAVLMLPAEKIKGIIYISPLLEDNLIMTKRFLIHCGNREIILLHGEADKRIPKHYIDTQVRYLRSNGINIKSAYYPGEDHFLMFSKWKNLETDIETWMKTNTAARRRAFEKHGDH